MSIESAVGSDKGDEEAIKRLFLAKMVSLHSDVASLRDLYAENPWLNDQYDIDILIPMSLDEWASELGGFIVRRGVKA